MAELKVKVEKILDIEDHPNADRLEIVTVKGWKCITGIGNFKIGDAVIYFPVDSILPIELEEKIFSDSKVKLSKSRVRAIKIRGFISQGLVVKPEFLNIEPKIGLDITDKLGVKKYEPPVNNFGTKEDMKKTEKQLNPYFKKYTDINHFNNYNNYFKSEDTVIITEKIHGINYRCSYVPVFINNWFKKILVKIGIKNKNEFVFGSHNVQLQNRMLNQKTFYDKNIYSIITKKYDFKNILEKNIGIYGEIYGAGIQKGYSYGLKNDIDLVIFDVMKDGKYMDKLDAHDYCMLRDLKFVPILDIIKFKDFNPNNYFDSPSILYNEQKIKEGIVLSPIEEKNEHFGRVIFKYINQEYLINENNTDYH